MTMGDSFGESGEARSFRAESVTQLYVVQPSIFCDQAEVLLSGYLRFYLSKSHLFADHLPSRASFEVWRSTQGVLLGAGSGQG